MDRLLKSARDLSEKVESNEGAAGELLRQCESLQQELKAMRQYRECVQVHSGGGDGSGVRLPNIEFSYIKQLQQDNSELRTLLEEHQAALQMIMSKYREQVSTFMETSHEEALLSRDSMAEELQSRTDQVYNMAAVMYKAALAEDASTVEVVEKVAKLEYENRHLRELLQFSSAPFSLPGSQCSSSVSNGQDSLRHSTPHHSAGGGVANCLEGEKEGDQKSECPTPKACSTEPQPTLELARDKLSSNSVT